ncbi:MAG: PQQ-binding-like beta-propeller repeat protein [Proteobacteria bacterium]|nr:PQQ-binding-like beta-propeller repeat protein [Pseudomonadota bacterium]
MKDNPALNFLPKAFLLLLIFLLLPVVTQAQSVKWTFPAGGNLYSSPSIASDGTVYIASFNGSLYAVNPDGSQKWVNTLDTRGGNIYSSPAIGADGTIYVGSLWGELYAIKSDGSTKWVFTTNGAVKSSPAIGADGTIYAGTIGGYLYAIYPDGTQKWLFTGVSMQWSSPSISENGTIYVGTWGSGLYAINSTDGSLKWIFSDAGYVYPSPAIGADGTIYVGSNNGYLYALDVNGTKQWAFQTVNAVHSSPAIAADGTIYVGSVNHGFYAIKPDGTQKWWFSEAGNVDASSPAIGADGTIYVGSMNSNLYAIDPDGNKIGSVSLGGNVQSSPLIGPDGTVYIGSYNFYLYALNSTSSGLAQTPWPMFRYNPTRTGSKEIPCAPGYYGPDCLECPGGAANPCNGHGTCDDDRSGTGACSCDPGFTDIACDGFTSTCEGACARTRATCEAMCYADCGGPGPVECEPCMADCLASYNTCLTVTCAPDDDGDGIPNTNDNCPDTANGPLLGTCISGDNAGDPCNLCVPACERERDTCEAICEVDYNGPGTPGYDECIADCETAYTNCVSNCPDECGGGFCSSNQEDSNGDGVGDVCYQSIEISDEQVIDSFIDDDGQTIDVIEYEFTITDNGVPVEGAEVYLEVEVIEEEIEPSLPTGRLKAAAQIKTVHKIVSHPSNSQGKTKLTFFNNGCSFHDDTHKYTFNHDKNKKHKWFHHPEYGCCQVTLTRCIPTREFCFKSTSEFCGLKGHLLSYLHLGSTSWTQGYICNSETGQCESSTLIELSSFKALPLYKSVKITWSTEAEINNAGFNLYRAESGDGEYVRINNALIPSKGSATQGSTYEFVDDNVKNRKTYWYKLEDTDLNGTSTMHGPVSATPKVMLSVIDWFL